MSILAVVGSPSGSGAYARVVEGPLSFLDPRIAGVGNGTIDNTAKFNTALGLLATTGGELFFPPGVYRIDGATNPVPGGVWLTGTGYDYHTPSTNSDRPVKHSVIRAGAAMTTLIQLGSGNADSSASGATGASLKHLVVDGNNLADTTVKTVARRNRIMECEILSGVTRALWIAGQNNIIVGNVLHQDNAGDVVLVQGYYDNKIWQNQIRGPGSTGAAIRITGSSQNDIQHNHMWAGANGTSLAAEGLIVLESTLTAGVYQTLIQNNTVEGVIGPEILLKIMESGAVIRGLGISGNRFYQPSAGGMTDAGQPVIQIATIGANQGFIATVNVSDNIIQGASASARYKSIVDWSAFALQNNERWVIDGNVGTFVGNLQTGTPFNRVGWGDNALHNGSTSRRSRYSDKFTTSGDGTTLVFSWPHSLDGVPASVQASPGSSDAAGSTPFYVSADATNITVTYKAGSAPVSGSNNLTWRWAASL